MSKIIRTQKPSVLPFYAMALVFVVLCAVLPVYKLWALLVALGGAAVAFGVAKKTCPPRVVEHEVPFHTGVEDVDAMLTEIQKQLDALHTLNEQLPPSTFFPIPSKASGEPVMRMLLPSGENWALLMNSPFSTKVSTLISFRLRR